MLCVKSHLRIQGKRVVNRQTVEGQEQATCLLMASRLCPRARQGLSSSELYAESLLRVGSELPVCAQSNSRVKSELSVR